MGNTVHGPERTQKTVLFQNLGGQTREMWETAVSPFCANREAYSRTRKKEKACLHVLTYQFHLKVTPQQNSQRSCPIQVPRFGN